MRQFFIKWAVASFLVMVVAVLVAVIYNQPEALIWVPAGGIPLSGLFLLFTNGGRK